MSTVFGFVFYVHRPVALNYSLHQSLCNEPFYFVLSSPCLPRNYARPQIPYSAESLFSDAERWAYACIKHINYNKRGTRSEAHACERLRRNHAV